MCGFVAIIGRQGYAVNRMELERATETLLHRGPDDSGFFVDGTVGLGFRRLSILDLSMQSHQPFEDADGRYVLVFNGEIYNYVELRQELQQKGYRFRSTGDAEVLLTAYKEWGKACLSRFNGMWAFVIYDRKDGSIFGSRDRFGVKPLFICDDGDRHILASEIKAITAMDSVDSAINWRIASHYLVTGRLSEPDEHQETIYAKILEVEAGHAFTIDCSGRFSAWSYWSLPTREGGSIGDPVPEFSRIFEDSVRLRLRSDVPVGVCLSGGLDSTAVICHMAKVLGPDRTEPLHAFSYIDEQFDETKEVLATVQETGAELHRLANSGASFLDKLEEVIAFHDEPLHSLNVLVSYQLYAMAAESGIKVILNGQGADETWAGYPSYFYNYWYGLVQSGKIGTARREMAAFAETHNVDKNELWKTTSRTVFRNQLRRVKIYRKIAALRAVQSYQDDGWFTQDFLSNYEHEVPEFESLDLDNVLRKSVISEPLPLYLRVEDRNSMAHSIETRLPFMDYRLVQLAFNSAPEWKLSGGLNKFALREAMRGVIPDVVQSRVDKMGFPVSARDWFAGPLYDVVRGVIGSSKARQKGVFNADVILADLDKHRSGEADYSEKLLRVMQFELLADKLGA